MHRLVFVLTVTSLLGCAKGTESSNPFLTGYTGQVPSGDTDDASGTGGSDTGDVPTSISGASASGGTSGTTSGDDGAGSTSSPTDPTTATTTGADGSTSGGSTSGDPSAGDESSGGGNQSGQPQTGMYAHCIIDQYDNCINGATTCIYTENPDDGYCTAAGCLNAAVDCDPAPAGSTASPICMSAGAQSFCALDCSVGGCPDGMECKPVTFDMVTTFDICM